MPTIEISKRDLDRLVGKRFSLDRAAKWVKAEVERDEQDKDLLRVELKDVNRPDLWSVEGIAREVKLKLGKKIEYGVERSSYVLKVSRKLKKIRPVIRCAVVKDLNFNEESIKQLIQLQEKLCESFGLKRKEAALGVYDLDKIVWPIAYTAYKPGSLQFKPLDMGQEMTLKEILNKHEKGKEYGHLISGFKEYPILIDSKKNVLSMPPIINSDYSGKVTEKTKNVFIEVTGLSRRFVEPVLNIFTAALAERGGKVYQVKIKTTRSRISPDLSEREITVDVGEINNMLGLELTEKQIPQLLHRSGLRIKGTKLTKSLTVLYPAYRQDIMDATDIIEDIAISYGYENLKPLALELPTLGHASKDVSKIEKIKELLVGLGCQEIATMNLTSPSLDKKARVKKRAETVKIENPISENYSCLRTWILPSILDFLSVNKNARYPQKVFEISKLTYIDRGVKEKTNLCLVSISTKVNFTELKQFLDYIMASLGLEYKLKEESYASFIDGRAGKILLKKDRDGEEQEAGFIGEIHPGVIEKFNLTMPVAALELDLDFLL